MLSEDGVAVGNGTVQGRELDLMILAGPFQLHIVYDSVKNGFLIIRYLLSAALFEVFETSGNNAFSFGYLNVGLVPKFTTCI